jgi:hypothetical protein
LGAVNYHFNVKKSNIQRVPELAPYPCMTDTESLKKLIFVKKKCPGFKGLRVKRLLKLTNEETIFQIEHKVVESEPCKKSKSKS